MVFLRRYWQLILLIAVIGLVGIGGWWLLSNTQLSVINNNVFKRAAHPTPIPVAERLIIHNQSRHAKLEIGDQGRAQKFIQACDELGLGQRQLVIWMVDTVESKKQSTSKDGQRLTYLQYSARVDEDKVEMRLNVDPDQFMVYPEYTLHELERRTEQAVFKAILEVFDRETGDLAQPQAEDVQSRLKQYHHQAGLQQQALDRYLRTSSFEIIPL